MAVKALPTIKRMQIINYKKFVKAALDINKKVYVIYVISITLEMAIYLACKAQIALFKAENAPVIVAAEYSNFVKIFLKNLLQCYQNLPKSIPILLIWKKVNSHFVDLFIVWGW